MNRKTPLRDYSQVLDRLKKAVGTTGFHSLAVLKTPTGQYPLVRTILGEGNQKRVLITAGIHGDEPAGVETILHLIETRALEPFLEDWEITLAPCINPTGFEAGTRENHLGQDLNRLFKTAAPPLEVTTVQSLFIHPFHLDVELHEDVDASGFYLYQKERNNPISDLGRKVLAAVSSLVPLNPAPEIEGMPAEDGLISRLSDPEEMDWWPMALFAHAKGCPRVLTLETPARHPMRVRVQALSTGIQTALDFS